MKSFAIAMLLFLFALQSQGQYEPVSRPIMKDPEDGRPLHRYYVGFGSGLSGKYGIFGLNFGTRLNPNTLAEINLGVGFWGLKSGFSVSTFVGPKNSWCPSLGITHNYGGIGNKNIANVTMGGKDFDVETLLDFKPINVLHASIIRQFLTPKGNRFFIELGLSIPLNETEVVFAQNTVEYAGNIINTSDLRFSRSQRNMYQILSPGGLNISFGYQLGFRNY